MSSDHEESDGDDGTAQMNPAYKDLEHPDRETPGLEAFKKMLAAAQETYEGFSYNMHIFHCPLKNDSIISRKKWRRAFLEDNGTRRAYIVASITYNTKKFCAIDIERDVRLPRASTLILSMNDSSDVPQSIISSIMNNYIRENQSWLYRMSLDNFQHTTLKHPHNSTNEAIGRWADRLITLLECQTTRTYTVKVNVHQVDPDLYEWEGIKSEIYQGATVEQKALLFSNTMHLFVKTTTEFKRYESVDGKSWAASTVTGLPLASSLKGMITTKDEMLLVYNHELYRSTNGSAWSKLTSPTVQYLS